MCVTDIALEEEIIPCGRIHAIMSAPKNTANEYIQPTISHGDPGQMAHLRQFGGGKEMKKELECDLMIFIDYDLI
jgi:hypothetical protein